MFEFGKTDSNTLVYIRDKYDNYLYISAGLFTLMGYPTDTKTINPGELWGRYQSDKIELHDNNTWITGGNQLLDILIVGGNKVVVSYQQRFIFQDKMFCVLGVLDYPFINRIKKYDVNKRIFYMDNGEAIRVNEIKTLVEYLLHEEVEDAAEKLCKAPITVYKSMQKLSKKLDYEGIKQMKIELLSNLLVPVLKKLIEL